MRLEQQALVRLRRGHAHVRQLRLVGTLYLGERLDPCGEPAYGKGPVLYNTRTLTRLGTLGQVPITVAVPGARRLRGDRRDLRT